MRARSFSFILMAAVSSACGDDTSTEPAPPPEPPRLEITTIDTVPSAALPSSGDEAPSFPNPLPLRCAGLVVVGMDLTDDFELKPPGSCGAAPRCGHVLLSATESASGTRVSVRAIAERTSIALSPPSSFVGSVRFDARLVLDGGGAFLTPEGSPVEATASADFSFANDCSPIPSDGGAGGAPQG